MTITRQISLVCDIALRDRPLVAEDSFVSPEFSKRSLHGDFPSHRDDFDHRRHDRQTKLSPIMEGFRARLEH